MRDGNRVDDERRRCGKTKEEKQKKDRQIDGAARR